MPIKNFAGTFKGSGGYAKIGIPPAGGAEFVTSGLKVHLDVGNPASYPGSGTTWSDLSGNGNHFTIVNSAPYSSGNGGYLLFHPVEGGNKPYATGPALALMTNWTAFAWVYVASYIGPIVCDSETTSSPWYWNFELRDGGEYMGNFESSGVHKMTNAAELNPVYGAWTCVAVTYDGTDLKAYRAGSFLRADTINVTIGGAGGYATWIGRPAGGNKDIYYNNATTLFDGRIAIVAVYDRALSASEILQNYNATSGRF